MKIAVLGAGPIGLHTTFKAIQLGASVTLFAPHGAASRIDQLAASWPDYVLGTWGELSLQSARDLLKLNAKESDLVNASDYRAYLSGLWELVASEVDSLKVNHVKRVHKRFLGHGEKPLGATRFFDLFRVVYGLDPATQMKQMGEEYPELTENLKQSLSEKDWQGLHSMAESFEDFDVVFDVSGKYKNPLPAGPSQALALNEAFVRELGGIEYGIAALKKIHTICESPMGEKRDYVIVGSGELAAMALAHLGTSENVNTLTVITSEAEPFLKLRDESKVLSNELEKILMKEAHDFEAQKQTYESDLHAWRALEPHEKSKIAAPAEPKRRLRLWGGANVTALDRLSDRQELFVTTELPAFRFEEKKEGEKLMTFACHDLFVLTGHKKTNLAHGLATDEVGHYSPNTLNEMEAAFSALLENFSRANS